MINSENKKLLIRRLVIISAFIYLLLVLLVYSYSDRCMFHPPESSYHDLPQLLKLDSTHKAKIAAVYLSNPKARYTLLYNHESNTDLGLIMPLLKILQQHNFAVFAYDYQGYGTSDGQTTEHHAYYDSIAAYNYLTQIAGVSPNNIIVYGKGLGAAISLELALHYPVAGLILESPFSSAFSQLTGLSWLPFDRFNNLHKIPRLSYPVLIMHGEKDKIVPIRQAKHLFAKINSPKFATWIPDAGHEPLMTTAPAAYWQAMDNFVAQLPLLPQQK